MMPTRNWNRTGLWLGGSLLAGLALGYAAGNDALQRLYPAPAAAATETESVATTAKQPAHVQPERYVEFGQFVVPVLRAGQTTAFILADITLDPGSVEKAVRIRSSLPRYRDVILRTLYAEAGKGVFEGPDFNPDRLGDHVGKALVAAAPEIGDGKVMFQRLLLQNNTR
jgi:hypothetical protein